MIVHSHYPVGEPRAEREARAAVDAGYSVDVVCLRAPHEPASETVDGIGIIRLPVEHIRGVGTLHTFLEYGRFALRATIATMRLHRRSPVDIVYVHAPPDFLIVAALIPRLLGSGVVLDIHDLSPHMFEARFGGRGFAGVAERALRFVERRACAAADRVVTVHDPYREELVANGVPASKIAVVMNGPEEEAVNDARARAKDADSRGFLVAYHGTLTHWYGVDLLIEAVARLENRVPQLRALILGEGDALATAEALAQELGIAGRTDFSRAYLPHAEALRRVAMASCGVIPNRPSRLNRFALSSKLLDYVALEVPVVVSRLETLAAHFSPDEVTFFEPADAESLAEGIAWVADHPTEAREKAKRARRRADEYRWSASRARLLESLSCAAS
jgi:glycosyltransferase involved in cell wall biosynthesis